MFSSKVVQVLTLAAASTVLSSHEVNALQVHGDFSVGLRMIPDLERSHRDLWRSHVVQIHNVQCVALGNGAFVTAGHVGTPKGATDHYRVRAHDRSLCDLILFRHSEGPQGIGRLAIAASVDRSQNELLVLANAKTQGLARLAPAANLVQNDITGRALTPGLHLFTPKFGTPGAADVEVGDSGSGVFRFDSERGGWTLAGILVSRVDPHSHEIALQGVPGSLSGAIDTSVATGVGQQLLDYRDGVITRGGLFDSWSRREKAIGIAGAGAAVLLGGALGAISRRRSKST
jgi:hypothetical protein